MKSNKQLKFLNVFCLEYYMWLENCICVYVHCNKCNTVAGGHILILAVSERKLLNAVLRVWLTNRRVRVQEKKQFRVKTIMSQCKIKTVLSALEIFQKDYIFVCVCLCINLAT